MIYIPKIEMIPTMLMIPKKIDIKASANILFFLSGLCSLWFPIISAVVTSYDRQGERICFPLSLFRELNNDRFKVHVERLRTIVGLLIFILKRSGISANSPFTELVTNGVISLYRIQANSLYLISFLVLTSYDLTIFYIFSWISMKFDLRIH